MVSTRSGASARRWAMIEDSSKGFLMESSGEGSFDLPSPKKHSAGASLTRATTTPWMENAPATQAMMTVPPWTMAPWPESSLPFEQCHAHHRGQQARARARQPTAEQEATPQRSKLTGKQVATAIQPHVPPRREPTLELERILMVDFPSTQP
jgi:hypothetical protein